MYKVPLQFHVHASSGTFSGLPVPERILSRVVSKTAGHGFHGIIPRSCFEAQIHTFMATPCKHGKTARTKGPITPAKINTGAASSPAI